MSCALLRYIDNLPQGRLYAGKIEEIKPIIEDWLAYTVQTFPHYTRHTIKHSEKIIEELSLLLFKKPSAKKPKPTIPLSAVEAYILVCAAYLHDAGMVISDGDKKDILDSEEWKKWVTEGEGADRYQKLSDFKEQNKHSLTQEKIYFSYNIELRHLIAEFVRRQHHFRSGNLIELSSQKMGSFDFNDPSLRKTIADICVAHGLDASDLRDDDRFPEMRTIKGEQVNVKLLAILFRLGDLLDMSSDRACPSLTAAANPIPPDSKLHWEQYSHILHRRTNPDAIEVSAECKSQEEHRTLKNWCSWIEGECKNADTIVPRMSMHSDWKVPIVKIDIKPAKDARYIAEDWKFIFDEEKIVRRLIQDVHPHGLGFLNELIQNALDATRCKMYSDLKAASKPTPPNPWQVPDEIRQNYPLKLIISKEKILNCFTEKEEDVLVVRVEDCGIGMSKNVVKNYFLQIGRSYYTSPDFSKQYSFQPISRYGIGFLSVFSKSNHVEVETYNANDTPLKMTLEGPKNYFLLENTCKSDTGTIVKVYLDKWDDDIDIYSYITSMCVFVEFPINLTYFEDLTTIIAETPADIIYQIPDVINTENEFILRSFPVLTKTLYGSLYVLEYKSAAGEDWSNLYYARHKYPKLSPTTKLPVLPNNLISFNGLGQEDRYTYRDENKIVRIDVRGKTDKMTLDKKFSHFYYYDENYLLNGKEKWQYELDELWKIILREHINKTCAKKNTIEKWGYLQTLPEAFPLKEFWEYVDGTVKVQYDDNDLYISLSDWRSVQEFTTYLPSKNINGIKEHISGYWFDARYLHSHFFIQRIFYSMSPINHEIKEDGELIIWRKVEENPYSEFFELIRKSDEHMRGRISSYICPMIPEDMLSYVTIQTMDDYLESLILNANHPFIKWLIDFSKSLVISDKKTSALEDSIKRLFKYHLAETLFSRHSGNRQKIESLKAYLAELECMPEFPAIGKAPIDSIIDSSLGVTLSSFTRRYVKN